MIVLQLIGFIAVMLGWSIYQVQKFSSPNQRSAAVTYSCLMGITMIAGSLFIAHIPLPSSTTLLRIVFEPVGKMILRQ
ncbi:hypothetical protein M3194_13235 [Paenibacillus glycanilyticus]|uniref:hypothetical protein n=1 Tax=Paenibacillus glycanilyticus TaxID=126569 RepID=UPI002040658F|nr:hypothetical protein [Paenibacillus glycanilyticus]MCM3628330.1 hypothetical protein [Paenibacillus glycanilyticus]